MSLTMARTMAEQLTTAGVRTVTDPRSVVLPCVLLTPPVRTYDLSCGYTATWQAYVLASGGGAEASWQALDELTDELVQLVDGETVQPVQYKLSPDAADTLPAFLVTFTSSVDPTE
jgi:hypothetical protein